MVDRVYEKNAAQSAPPAPADPSVGYPTSGNPAQGVPATVPGDYWYHMITEALRNVILDAGLTPDHEDLGQLLAAIRGLAATTTQKGTVEAATPAEAKGGAAGKFPDAAGVLAAIQQYGMGAESIPVIDNLDTIMETSLSGYSSDTTGAPTAQHGSVLTVRRTAGAATQFAMEYNVDEVYVRHYATGAWGLWARNYTDRNFPPASQTEVDAGADDKKYVTPKKLRWGVSYSIGLNGYIAFPSWLGGLVLQWLGTASRSDSESFSWPIPFPNDVFLSGAFDYGAGVDKVNTTNVTASGGVFKTAASAGDTLCSIFSIGH